MRRSGFLLALAVASALFLAPLPNGGETGGVAWDKVGHVAVLAALGVLAGRAWPERRGLAYAALVVYAIAIEGLQAATTWRTADPWDALAGAIGALTAFVPAR